MKTVSGEVVSSQQISLSKAAKLISRFTASDNEATPAYAAYLRHTSAAFDELNQLHKEYKVPVGKLKTKKDHSSIGVVTDGTGNSVKMAGDYGVEGEKRDRVNEIGLNVEKDLRKASTVINERKVDGNVADVGGVLKKSKKKKGSDGDVAIAVNNQPSVEHDAIKVNDVEKVIGTLHGSEELKKNVTDVDGVGKKSKKKKEKDGDVAITVNNQPSVEHDVVKVNDVENEIGTLHGSEEIKKNVADVGVVGKKLKKKKGSDSSMSIIDKGKPNDAINMNEVKNEMGNFNTSEETKKKEKKKDKHEKDNHDGVKEFQLRPHRRDDGIGQAVDTVQNNGDVQKKHKKSKVKEVKESSHVGSGEQMDDKNVRNKVNEERESCSIRNIEQSLESKVKNKDDVRDEKKRTHEAEEKEKDNELNIGNIEQSLESKVKNKDDVRDEKKHKKKRTHEAEEKEKDNERNIETEVGDKKASRKRKHERVTDGEVSGSQDAVISKKKKM